MKFRASGIAPLFLGMDGLTEAQERDLKRLLDRKSDYESGNQKSKLTDKMESDLADLISKRDAEPELPKGAMSYIEDLVDQELYMYDDFFTAKELEKGSREDVENESIELYNDVFFTDHKKLVEGDKYYYLEYNGITGHPDIVCELTKMVKDAKSSWNKKTFKKRSSDAINSTYEWQVRSYLYMLQKITGDNSWMNGEYFYALVSTPEELVPEYENDSLHNVVDIPDNMRLTVCHVTLDDKIIAHMERRLDMAKKYADKYKQELINKNK